MFPLGRMVAPCAAASPLRLVIWQGAITPQTLKRDPLHIGMNLPAMGIGKRPVSLPELRPRMASVTLPVMMPEKFLPTFRTVAQYRICFMLDCGVT